MKFNNEMMSLLKKIANDSFVLEDVPVAAIIFDKDMNVISYSGNNRQSTGNILGHAEILSILEAEKKIGDWRLNGYSMLVNLEPCTMCSSVIKESRLDCVYYLLKKDDLLHEISINSVMLEGYEEEKLFFKMLLKDFFDNMR